jgi:hypothetical protein
MQEMFDHVASNLLRQGKKSVDRVGCPTWFGDGGARCALGWLLPDEASEWPRYKVDSFVRRHFLNEGPLSSFFNSLMLIHDGVSPEYWRHELRRLASNYGLNAAVLDAPTTDDGWPPKDWSKWLDSLPPRKLVKVRVPKPVSFSGFSSTSNDSFPTESVYDEVEMPIEEARARGYSLTPPKPYFVPKFMKEYAGAFVASW